MLLLRYGAVRKTRWHQKVNAFCAGRYGRQRRLTVVWPAATTGFLTPRNPAELQRVTEKCLCAAPAQVPLAHAAFSPGALLSAHTQPALWTGLVALLDACSMYPGARGRVHVPPKTLDEKVAQLHLRKAKKAASALSALCARAYPHAYKWRQSPLVGASYMEA